jgi:hypothetical protein
MSCDIHVYIEYGNDDGYNLYASPDFPQSYFLFCLLAGVRKEWVDKNIGEGFKAIYEPRGIPNNASFYTLKSELGYLEWDEKTDTWDAMPDWHSTSHLNTEEFKYVINEYKQQIDDPDFYIYEATIALMLALPNARIVFWFDN